MKFYQIGKFASKLGVTHDLLKHYEKYGIIQSKRQGDGGYRYYPYTQVPNILSSKEFQNWGFSLREISTLLKGADVSDYYRTLGNRVLQMEQEQTLKHRYLDSAKHLLSQVSQIKEGKFSGSWSIEEQESSYYLPHSSGTDFELIDINEHILASWIEHLSITSIATRVYQQHPGSPYNRLSDGFLVSEADAQRFQIPLTDCLIRIPRRKYLIYHSELPTGSRDLQEVIDSILREPFALIQKHCFSAKGDIYSKTLLKTQEEDRETIYRIVYIPLDIIE
ncbi:MAG: MerR family transcriptional regulator [Hungatella sp.]|jgi:DNA-binding transcriptional MerR regulator|nr:MerR family transcriptional regulator [Hungatella sp.]